MLRSPPISTLFPYTTLFRSLRGVFFAIASLALSVVLYIFIVNWDYVGGARGAYVLQPRDVPFGLPRRSEEHTSELQSHVNLVCRLLLEKKNNILHTGALAPP